MVILVFSRFKAAKSMSSKSPPYPPDIGIVPSLWVLLELNFDAGLKIYVACNVKFLNIFSFIKVE